MIGEGGAGAVRVAFTPFTQALSLEAQLVQTFCTPSQYFASQRSLPSKRYICLEP